MSGGPKAFVEDLWVPIREAAAIARSLEGRVANVPKSGEDTDVKSALTAADTACQEALLVPLLRRFSDVRLEAEEDTESVGRFTGSGDARVVIDPIDGTLRSYLGGEGPYAVMAGLDLEDRFQGIVVALPREEFYLRAQDGGGVELAEGDGEPQPVRASRDGMTVYISYDLPEPVRARLEERGYTLQQACGGSIAVAPLLPGVCGGLRVPSPRPISLRGRIGLLASVEGGAHLLCVAASPTLQLSERLPHVAVAADEATGEDLAYALQADR